MQKLLMANDFQQLMQAEKPSHFNYLRDFRVEQCQLFLQHKCTQHRPFTCFHWHFQNQRRRRPLRRADGTFSYDPDFYCNEYDEQTGICPKGDDCQLLHRNANDTEKRYHLRYFKTCLCTHETDSKGHCLKNGIHCPYAHGANDLRQAVLDSREIQNSDLALERLTRLCISLENERALNDDPKWNDSHYVLANYKTEPCKRPPRLCRQGYACPQFHNPRDRRRNPSIFKYKSTPCPHVKQNDEWVDPTVCEAGDACKYCHTRTEQQFHPEIYKSTKCNDVSVTLYCPRGPFCAFAHVEQEIKSYRDFDLHFPNELPLSSFIPIPEEKEVGIVDALTSIRNHPKKTSQPSLFDIGSYPSSSMKPIDRNYLTLNNPTNRSLTMHDMFAQMSPVQNRVYRRDQMFSQLPTTSPYFNDQTILSSPTLAPSHSYPPPASNLFSSITSLTTDYFDSKRDNQDQQPLPFDVKNLIESSLNVIGLDNVADNDFDRAAATEKLFTDLYHDDDMESFDRSTNSALNNKSPTNKMTRPMNIPNSFTNDYFSPSSSAKSPFDGPNQILNDTLESPIDNLFSETSTSNGTNFRTGELFKTSAFNPDIRQSNFQHQNTIASSIEIDAMRNRILQMQFLAMTEKESSDHWRREAEDNHRVAIQLEQEKNRAIQQRDDALQKIEQMRQFYINNMRLLPSDQDLMQLPLDDVRSLQSQLQKELLILSTIEQAKSNNLPKISTTQVISSTPRPSNSQQNITKNILISSTSKQ